MAHSAAATAPAHVCASESPATWRQRANVRQDRAEGFDRHAAGTPHERRRDGEVQHGRFHADAWSDRRRAPDRSCRRDRRGHVPRTSGWAARSGWRSAPQSGLSTSSRSAWATGCAGTRTPTVSRPAVTTDGTCGCLNSTIVSGPGQKRAARSRDDVGHVAGDHRHFVLGPEMNDHRIGRGPALRLEQLRGRRLR